MSAKKLLPLNFRFFIIFFPSFFLRQKIHTHRDRGLVASNTFESDIQEWFFGYFLDFWDRVGHRIKNDKHEILHQMAYSTQN